MKNLAPLRMLAIQRKLDFCNKKILPKFEHTEIPIVIMRCYLGYIRRRDLRTLATFTITNGITYTLTHSNLDILAREGMNKAKGNTYKALRDIYEGILEKLLKYKKSEGPKPLHTSYNLKTKTYTYMDGTPIVGQALESRETPIEAILNRKRIKLTNIDEHINTTTLETGHKLAINMLGVGSVSIRTREGLVMILQDEEGKMNVSVNTNIKHADLAPIL